MSILDKHPAPWRKDSTGAVVDVAGNVVVLPFDYETGRSSMVDDDVLLLILAAPELLAALKKFIEGVKMIPLGPMGNEAKREAKALIARIEGGK